MLALSTLSMNSRVVSGLWVGIWILSSVVAGAVGGTTRYRESAVLSYMGNLDNLRQSLLGTYRAKAEFASILDSIEQPKNGPPAGFWFGRRPPPPQMRGPGALSQQPWFKDWLTETHPVAWSWAVFLALFGLSVLLLSVKVKSLDRIR